MFSQKSVFAIIILFLVSLGLHGQEVNLKKADLKSDSIPSIRKDSTNTRPAPTDSLIINKDGFETTIKYYAEDSIITKTLTNVTYLYGKAYIIYGDIRLDAAEIIIDREKNELRAKGVQDSTGTWQGLPLFKDGPEEFETREIRYNFTTNRARIKGVAAQQQDGYLSGDVVKRNADGSAFISGGRFIPCDDPLATTYIKSTKIKMIPGDKIITGPFLLYVGDIPTPLGLPFFMFPEPKSAEKSGILFPKYGTEQNRGLFLREGGYFFVWNRKLHTALTGDIYSKGSWGLKAQTTYKNRYKYSGNFRLEFNRNRNNIEIDEVPLDSKDFWFQWSHSPESRGNGRFSASVNVGTSTFNSNTLNLNNFQNNVRSEFRSNISYSSSIAGTPLSYSLSARHNQNVQTGIMDVSLPELSVNMNRIYPAKRSKSDILKKLNVGWNFNVSNQVTNLVRPASAGFDIANGTAEADTIDVRFNTLDRLLQNAKNGARHTIPISTSFTFLKNFNVTPSIQFEELWYLEELDYTYDSDQNAVRIDTLNGFSRASTYSASVGISTQIYGDFNFGDRGKLQAIRHIVTPSLSFSYRPDFSQEKFGFYQTVQTGEEATDTRLLSIYDGFVFGSPGLGESAAMSFSVNNKIEAKIRSDTAQAKKVPILENLAFNGSYNFLADSFNLSTINMTARTTLFDRKLNINMGMTLDPYTRLTTTTENEDGSFTSNTTRVNEFAWNSGQRLGTISTARLALSTNLNSSASSGPSNAGNINPNQRFSNGFVDDPTGEFGSINDGGENLLRQQAQYFYDPNAYVDLDIPWNIRFSYDYNFTRGLNSTSTRQAVKLYGQVSLTPKWQLTLNTGYDIDMKEITQTSLGIYRELGCWEMRANWVPFGRFTSYNIDIQIKSSVLKDLKISRRRSFFDN